MKTIPTQFKPILLMALLLLGNLIVLAQGKAAKDTRYFKNFSKLTNRAGISFTLPAEFKAIPITGESNNYDYGMALSDADFQIWFKVTPVKENTSDSIYLEIGKNQAKLLAGDNNPAVRNLPEKILSDYNADAGKTYFINLPDAPGVTHYKYALLITLQKSHKGNVVAVCLTNDKGPDFFKNITKASNCLKFKSGA